MFLPENIEITSFGAGFIVVTGKLVAEANARLVDLRTGQHTLRTISSQVTEVHIRR